MKKLFFLLFFVLSCSFLMAQDEATSDSQVQSSPEAQPDTQKEVLIQVESEVKPGNVTLDFRDADIRNVLRILSYKSGVNIIVGPEVTGLVTIQLTDVPWETALDVILRTYGYGYERKGNIITVTTFEKLSEQRRLEQELKAQEPLVTEVFTLNFAKAEAVVGSIKEMLTTRGRVNFDNRTNTVMVTDSISNIDRIKQIVPTLDAVTPQVLIETKIIKTTLTDTENLGVDWTAQITVSGAQHPTIWPFGSEKSNFSEDYLPDAFPATTAVDGTGSGRFRYGTLDFASLQAVLQVLSTRTDTNILSNPRIVTLDNQAANIIVGKKYPQPQYTYNAEQAKMQVSGWEYLDIGIILNVTPHVNKAGFVTLDIAPQVSDIDSFATVEGTSMPILTTEQAKTQVMIKDGETLVIAGLIKDQVSNTKNKIPILGDIPLIGLLFKKKTDTKQKTDLLIFITPHIITPVMAAESPEA
ncbi:MAG: type IV pilus secretin PilQ [Candidatus Omnitrophica bacterium]|nr:type IV pilus secretin PilQ [Candidatus Omnitrophota bacterium]